MALYKGRNYCRPPWPYKNHGPGPVGWSSCGKSRMRAGGLRPRSPPSTRLVNNTAPAQLETPKAPWRTVQDPTRLTCLSDCPEALIGEVSCIFLVLLAASSSREAPRAHCIMPSLNALQFRPSSLICHVPLRRIKSLGRHHSGKEQGIDSSNFRFFSIP